MADTIVWEITPAPLGQREIQTGLVPHTMSYEERRAGLLALLAERMADESGYDEETWPALKAALDRDRLSDRKLFNE